MTSSIELHNTSCAICGTEGNADELYGASFNSDDLNPSTFSARRLPDRVHFRIVKCRSCGLVRSDPVADIELLAHLYRESSQTYGDEILSLRETYGKYLRELNSFGVTKGSLLEVGCGSGFFLEEALAQGYPMVRGVEPGRATVNAAGDSVRDLITCDLMRAGLFEDESFDVICIFQVFDHLPDPGQLLTECRRVLKKGGLILCLNHNVGALSARILRERSPIIDVEHMYLYDRRTFRRIFEQHDFEVLRVDSSSNWYSIRYLAQLVPLPRTLKLGILALLDRWQLGRLKISAHLGNQYLIARRT